MRQLLIIIAAAITTACSTLPAPETPREILAATEVSFAATTSAAIELANAGVLVGNDLILVIDKLSKVNDAIELAHLALTSPLAAEGGPTVAQALEALREALILLENLDADFSAITAEAA